MRRERLDGYRRRIDAGIKLWKNRCARICFLPRCYGLDAQPYRAECVYSITYEKGTLRTWLNDDFINRAFTAAEQSAILLTNVDNSANECRYSWAEGGGNNTRDKAFLLNFAEATKYLGSTTPSGRTYTDRVVLTEYAEAQGANTYFTGRMTADGKYPGSWWLRSPSYEQSVYFGRNAAARVDKYGALDDTYALSDNVSVRPALWVDITAIIF